MRTANRLLTGRRASLLGATIVVAVTAVAWWPVLAATGAITSGDLFIPFRSEGVEALYGSFWNPILAFPNVETIDRLAFMAPFLAIPDPSVLQRALLATVLFGASLSMFLATSRLGAPWILAVLAAIAYACNPWIANRLQHVFLLPGYAVLPAVLALWIRPPERHASLALVLLLTLGSTTPHTTAALWGLLVVLLMARPSPDAFRRFTWTASGYALVNLFWLLPAGGFAIGTELVPSWPTIQQLELFSRHADLAAVLRLEGYWWPLAEVTLPAATRFAGLGLAMAALASLHLRDRERLALFAVAGAVMMLALGTRAPVGFERLVLDGPLADRVGWLLRDPNKAVGLLAGLLLLLAAGARRRERLQEDDRVPSWSIAVRSLGLVAYLSFALPYVSTYSARAYESHPVPQGIHDAADWLADRSGRASWVPAYFGAQTFWNSDQLTPELLSASSPVPVLSPYGYDERAMRTFLTLDHGALLGDLPADVTELMPRWGVRWLVHHRDVLPGRLQPSGAYDPRVEVRALRVRAAGLPTAASFPSTTIYQADTLPPGRPVVPMLTQRPTAAAAALSLLGTRAQHRVTVEADHPGVRELLILSGDDPVVLLADGQIRVDLAAETPHAVPAERWSRFGETDLAWWPRVAARGGPPPADAGAVITTHRDGAELRAPFVAPAGTYDVFTRAYTGPEAGAVEVTLGDEERWVVDLESHEPAMAWMRLGTTGIQGGTSTVRIVSLAGSNVIADFRLIPHDASTFAAARATELDAHWLWIPASGCLAGDAGTTPVDLAVSRALPWDGALPGGVAWSEIRSLELTLQGRGDGTRVEVWTRSGDTWLFLGAVPVWWSGLRTAILPLSSDAFAFLERGPDAEASFLRLLPVDSSGTPLAGSASEAHLGVETIRLRTSARCAWTFRSLSERSVALHAPGATEPFPYTIDGHPRTFDPDASQSFTLPSGEHMMTFPDGLPDGVEGMWLGTAEPFTAPEAKAVSPQAHDCPNRWRLHWSHDRWIEGLSGSVDDRAVASTPVDGWLAGYWMPPGVCGEIAPRNPWRALGTTSVIASVIAFLALAAVSFRGRAP